MKRITTAIAIAAAIMAVALLTACTTASAVQEHEATSFKYVHDWAEPKVPSGAVRIAQEQEAKAAEKAAQEPQEPEEAPAEDEWAHEEEWAYYEPQASAYAFTGDGFMQEGVRDYKGRTESWYSSNQLYHRDTAEWTVDDEGYYRDDQGRYVVAASDAPEGSEIETSKGTGIVLDSGCDEGVTDFYTAF